MSVPNLMTIHPKVAETFHSTSTHVNLTVALKEKSVDAKVSRIHPLSTMNVDTDYANSH